MRVLKCTPYPILVSVLISVIMSNADHSVLMQKEPTGDTEKTVFI